tara:strand:+ start:2622 stop:2864 length:243 start_codon:yes stop_codon:yes gene_type:complete
MFKQRNTQKEKCDFLRKKWLLCRYFNSKLPQYEHKPYECDEKYKEFIRQCYEKDKIEKDKIEKDKIEKDKIFKCSIFSTY